MIIFQEEMAQFVERAIERGQEAQDEGKKLIQEMQSRQRKEDPKIKDALERLDVPSQKDIEDLNQNIAALAQRIDEVKSAG
jgi:polyhydroxyalkanoate synthesis regulator phasin